MRLHFSTATAFLAALALLTTALGAQGRPNSEPCRPHNPPADECVEVAILSSPHQGAQGETILPEASLTNCGGELRGVVVSWLLVDQQGDATLLARRVAQVAPGETIAGAMRLLVPVDQKLGMHQLTLVARTPHGAGDQDSAPIVIVPPPAGGGR